MSLTRLALLVSGYLLCGATAKLADDALDEQLYPFWFGVVSAAVCTLTFACFVLADYWSRPIFIGITLGVLLARKVDNWIFVGIVVVGGVLPLIIIGPGGLDWPALGLVALWAWLDELGNDWADRRQTPGRIGFFLKYRFGLKLGIFLLCLVYALPWVYLLAFLVFDAGYGLLAFWGGRRAAKLSKPASS